MAGHSCSAPQPTSSRLSTLPCVRVCMCEQRREVRRRGRRAAAPFRWRSARSRAGRRAGRRPGFARRRRRAARAAPRTGAPGPRQRPAGRRHMPAAGGRTRPWRYLQKAGQAGAPGGGGSGRGRGDARAAVRVVASKGGPRLHAWGATVHGVQRAVGSLGAPPLGWAAAACGQPASRRGSRSNWRRTRGGGARRAHRSRHQHSTQKGDRGQRRAAGQAAPGDGRAAAGGAQQGEQQDDEEGGVVEGLGLGMGVDDLAEGRGGKHSMRT